MLEITVPGREFFDEDLGIFVTTKPTTLRLEHSLVSLSKWESKWEKPFLDPKTNLTDEEVLDYVRCMTLTQNVDNDVYLALTEENLKDIERYVNSSQTATWFSDTALPGGPQSREIITSEIIYWWMIMLNIPTEFQKWHLNRLITLIKVVNVKANTNKKMSKKDVAAQQRKLNMQRRAKLGSKG